MRAYLLLASEALGAALVLVTLAFVDWRLATGVGGAGLLLIGQIRPTGDRE